jgi:hypothetical protein
VRTEAFRTLYGRDHMPDAITVWMVDAGHLAAAPPEQRGLVRALGAQRLGLHRPRPSDDPELLWSRLARVSPHISLSGRTRGDDGGRIRPVARRPHPARHRQPRPHGSAVGDLRKRSMLVRYMCLRFTLDTPLALGLAPAALYVGCSDGLIALNVPAPHNQTGVSDNSSLGRRDPSSLLHLGSMWRSWRAGTTRPTNA